MAGPGPKNTRLRRDSLPPELEDLLTARGRRILAGRDPACGLLAEPDQWFASLEGVLDPRKAARCRAVLDRTLFASLEEMSLPIPPETITELEVNYGEWLPKTGRMKTAYLEHRRARSYRIAEEIGLIGLLRSESFGRFAAAVSGRRLRPRWGTQVLCYTPGDYAGPHNDHHPEDAEARGGYLDMHLTFSSPAVAHQWLVYGRGGHLSEIRSVNTNGGITLYRLPFWHYTTPLVALPKLEARARRWVLLGTFLFANVANARRGHA